MDKQLIQVLIQLVEQVAKVAEELEWMNKNGVLVKTEENSNEN